MQILISPTSGASRIIKIEDAQRPRTKGELLEVFKANGVEYSNLEIICANNSTTLVLPDAELPSTGDLTIVLAPAKIKGNTGYDLSELENLPEVEAIQTMGRDEVRSKLREIRSWADEMDYGDILEQTKGFRDLSADAMRALLQELIRKITPVADQPESAEVVQGVDNAALTELANVISSVSERVQDIADRLARIEDLMNLLPGAEARFNAQVEGVRKAIKS